MSTDLSIILGAFSWAVGIPIVSYMCGRIERASRTRIFYPGTAVICSICWPLVIFAIVPMGFLIAGLEKLFHWGEGSS